MALHSTPQEMSAGDASAHMGEDNIIDNIFELVCSPLVELAGEEVEVEITGLVFGCLKDDALRGDLEFVQTLFGLERMAREPSEGTN